MKRPESVKVIGQTFDISWVDEVDPLSNRDHLGRTEVTRLVLTVDGTTAVEQRRDTLLHELIHASLRMTGSAGLNDDQEERVVGLLAPILLDVLRANPEVAEYLVK